jgi:prepilin-type N-terminal cleavage/methylation domain-containing protein
MKKGFTLIELLVVIAIIAILAAILFPVFTAAKQRSAVASCLNNLKQLSSGISLYADNYNGRFPLARIVLLNPGENHLDWVGSPGVGLQVRPEKGQIWPYVKSKKTYVCPSDVGRPALLVKGSNGAPIRDYASSYTMNTALCNATTRVPLLMDSVTRPTRCLLLIHESRSTIDDGDFWWDGWNEPEKIHYDGTTVVYVDGHALWQSNKKLVSDRDNKYWLP